MRRPWPTVNVTPVRTLDLFVVLTIAAALLAFVAGAIRPYAGELSHGFAAYYTSAKLVASGEDPVRFYENRWFMERTIETGFGETPDIYNVNPPTTSLMFLPIQWLSPAGADTAWTVLNVMFLTAALLVLFQVLVEARLLSWRTDRALIGLLTALALVFNPIHENFRYGQAYLFMLLLTALAMRAYVHGRDRETGIWLGMLLLAKSSGTLLWLAPLLDFLKRLTGRRPTGTSLRGPMRTLAWGVLTIVAGVILAAPLLGIRVWWEYIQWLPSLVNQRWTGVTAYQTTASLINHLTKAEPTFSPHPLIDAGWLATPLTMLISIVILALAALAGWRWSEALPDRQLHLARFAMISALAVPLQPVGEEHHYALLLPAVFVSLTFVRRWPERWLAIVGVVMLAAPLPFKDDAVRDGWLALLAYPKLYGALLVAASLAVTMAGDRMGAQRQSW